MPETRAAAHKAVEAGAKHETDHESGAEPDAKRSKINDGEKKQTTLDDVVETWVTAYQVGAAAARRLTI